MSCPTRNIVRLSPFVFPKKLQDRGHVKAGIPIVTVLLLLTRPAILPSSGQTVSRSDSTVSRLEQELPALMTKAGIPGVSFALLRDGRLFWSDALGIASRETRRRRSAGL